MKTERVCDMKENELPKTPRRVTAAEASATLRRPPGESFPIGSGLPAALARRVVKADEVLTAAWPLGSTERGEAELFPYYHRAVRRWLTLRRVLGCVLCEGGVIAPLESGSGPAILMEGGGR